MCILNANYDNTCDAVLVVFVYLSSRNSKVQLSLCNVYSQLIATAFAQHWNYYISSVGLYATHTCIPHPAHTHIHHHCSVQLYKHNDKMHDAFHETG